MSDNRDYETLGWLAICIIVVFTIFWAVNAYKFTDCDFKSPYRCEAIHAVGIIPVFSIVTVWFDTDKP